MQKWVRESPPAKSGEWQESAPKEAERAAYLDSSRRGAKGGDKSLSQRTRTQQRRDGAGWRRTEPLEESRFGDDQFLKLFGHLLFAHDSFTQKDTKNRFEGFLCRWRDLRGPFASPCTVGWNGSYRGGQPRSECSRSRWCSADGAISRSFSKSSGLIAVNAIPIPMPVCAATTFP